MYTCRFVCNFLSWMRGRKVRVYVCMRMSVWVSAQFSMVFPFSNNNNNNYKRTGKIVDFAVPVDHRIKLKESEKKDKYLNLARELKKNYGTWRWWLYQLGLVLLLL